MDNQLDHRGYWDGETDTNPQLGAYQLAVDAGAVEGLPPGATSAGAQLVFVSDVNKNKAALREQPALGPDAPDDPSWSPSRRSVARNGCEFSSRRCCSRPRRPARTDPVGSSSSTTTPPRRPARSPTRPASTT